MGSKMMISQISIWFVSASLIFFPASVVDGKDNPADELVAIINSNRTAHKSTTLLDNAGLGCMALQYIKAYQGQCRDVADNKKPAESNFIELFSPNCGILATSLSNFTGRLIACQSTYVPPAAAFDILINSGKNLEILYSKDHTQVGAAVSGSDGGSPYFWCVLFSGGKPNSTFVPESGVLKVTRPGCFSGNNEDCSGSVTLRHSLGLAFAIIFAGWLHGFGF